MTIDEKKTKILSRFFDNNGKPQELFIERCHVMKRITDDWKYILTLLKQDGYIDVDKYEVKYFATSKAIKISKTGFFNPTLFQKVQRILSKEENVKWIIGIILGLIIAIVGWRLAWVIAHLPKR